MKKLIVKSVSIVMAAIIVLGSLGVMASAATSWPAISRNKPMKAYTISTGNNTTAYTSTSLSAKKGTIYASDELHIYSISKNSNGIYVAYCSYPTSNNNRKYAYIPLSVITTAKAPAEVNSSRANLTTYRRASSSATAGSISKGDKVYKIATSGSYTQVVYNIGSVSNPSGWRMAWITTANYNNYVKSAPKPAPTPVVNSKWQSPMKNMYCTWRSYGKNLSFGDYTSNSSGRNYHLGIDVYGTSGNVYAAADGTVVACSSSTKGANGRYIIIKHTVSGKTVYSFYAHLASLNVSNGQTVKAGHYIAKAGGSGNGKNNYYGTHLHFAIVDTLWTNGSYYGYSYKFTGNKHTFNGVTFYNPVYVINNSKLP